MSAAGNVRAAEVAICTHNRCDSLGVTLASFERVRAPAGVQWTLLVIDNASTDATLDVIRSFESRLPLRAVRESEIGLSAARNRAVRETRSELLLFTDDDVLIDAGWIEAVCGAAACWPDAVYFGGRVLPRWPHGAPGWFRQETLSALGGILVSYDLGGPTRLYREGDAPPIGANMSFRAQALRRAGLFRTDLGPRGARRGSGDDTEMGLRLARAGGRGCYVAEAVCHHVVDPRRTTWRHALAYGAGRGRDDAAMRGGGTRGSPARAVAFGMRACGQAIKGRGDRVRMCLFHAGVEFGRWGARVKGGGRRA